MKQGNGHGKRPKAKTSLESSLLAMEERAGLLEVDLPQELAGYEEVKQGCCMSCRKDRVCCDIGSISLVATALLILLGVLLLVFVKVLSLPFWVDQLSRYTISAGVFGLASGGTNAIALLMLFYKIPLVCGSGVFYKQHRQIRNVIKTIVLQLLFNSEHLQNYISRKIRQFSSHVQVTESITQALNSRETSKLINRRLDIMFAEPEAQLLQAVGLSRTALEAVVRPAVLSLCAESAPYVLDNMHQQSQFDRPKAISVPRFRKEMDSYLSWRVEELTEQHIGKLMRRLLYQHLGWVVVWGSVIGLLSGIVTQGIRISFNFNFFS